MRDSAIEKKKRPKKIRVGTGGKKVSHNPKGRRPNTDNPSYWSGNSAAILQRLMQNLMEKERKNANKKE